MIEKKLDKISKLLAMAESAKKIGSVAEAEKFAAQAEAWLFKYDLTMDDVELHAAQQEPIALMIVPGELPFPLWKLQILKCLAQIHGCFQVDRVADDQPCLTGRKKDREVTLSFFNYFVEAGGRLEAQLRVDHLQSVEFFTTGRLLAQSNVDAYLWGYAAAVTAKLIEVYGTTRDETEDINPEALIFLEKREQEAREWLENKGAVVDENVTKPTAFYDRDYVIAGAVAGDGVALTDKILG